MVHVLNHIHYCDSYVKSIKNVEQQARGGLYHITGADQIRPKDFRLALRSPKFKNAIIKFFMEEWKENKYSAVMKQKTVVVAHEEQCLLYTATLAGSVEHSEAHEYVCTHVEADTRMVYHLSVLPKQYLDRILLSVQQTLMSWSTYSIMP